MALTKIKTDGIADGSVTNPKIADGSVTNPEIADDAVNSEHYADLSINTAHLNNNAVTLAKLEDGDANNDGKFLRANNGADPTFETIDLTALSASNLTSGTIPDARFPTTLPAVSGANLTGISTTPADGSITQAKVNFPVANRNLVINGAMRVAQRNTSSTANGYKTIDRYYHSYNGTDEAITVSQADVNSSDSGDNPYAKGITKSLKITNGDQTSIESADYMRFTQILEAADLRNSGWDYNSTSSYITLSFYVKSSVAQNFYGILFTQDGSTKMFTFQTGSLTANTWKRVTVSIPGYSGIQFDDNNKQGLFIYWWAYNGTSYANASNTSNSLNQWSAFYSNARTPVMDTTWWTTDNATFEVTGIQLEVGSVATEFEHEHYGTTLAKCQRYYYKHEMTDSIGPYYTQYHSGHKFVHDFFPVTMRTAPTASVSVQTNSDGNNPYKISPNHYKAYLGSSYTDGTSHYMTSATYDAEL